MKIPLFLTLFFPLPVFAHCPYEVTSSNKSYCLELYWDTGEKKIKGQFEPSDVQTPYLVPVGEVPQKWIYSKVLISTWEKGDKNHKAVEIPGFRVFPYMHMKNGHHHSAGYEFNYAVNYEMYIVDRVVFQQMPGCWSLRWTTEKEDSMKGSQLLINMTNFRNLNEDQVVEQEKLCSEVGQGHHGGGHGDHKH